MPACDPRVAGEAKPERSNWRQPALRQPESGASTDGLPPPVTAKAMTAQHMAATTPAPAARRGSMPEDSESRAAAVAESADTRRLLVRMTRPTRAHQFFSPRMAKEQGLLAAVAALAWFAIAESACPVGFYAYYPVHSGAPACKICKGSLSPRPSSLSLCSRPRRRGLGPRRAKVAARCAHPTEHPPGTSPSPGSATASRMLPVVHARTPMSSSPLGQGTVAECRSGE